MRSPPILVLAALASLAAPAPAQTTARIATFNVEDLRTEDLQNPSSPRAKRLAEVIQRLAPNIILLNEIAYDGPDSPGFDPAAGPGLNGQRFADAFLAVPQIPGLPALRYKAFMAPVNTGVPSGLDLNNDGRIITTPPAISTSPPDAEARAYAEDCWGFGTFPGQYGMALLVDERLTILADEIRTFRLLPWDYMPGAFLPQSPDGRPWYDDAEKAVARLSSKSHWDIPIQFPDGRTVHFLCSHPTPPAFDGPDKRNARRNHDEIRFWADYITSATYLVDDKDRQGGLDRRASFIILGDLNADPDEGDGFKQPITTALRGCERISFEFTPTSDVPWPGLDADDTALFKLRVDYILPSRNLEITAGGVWRPPPDTPDWPSDHFPVWAEVFFPPMMKD
ncbi:MAG: endonuclease/exonuclease/phosphatase family protein [Phycisphaerales bacterium]|nr:endonuclease/exonuclease/phosphatase family protein [Phycisphaerales bacterium]